MPDKLPSASATTRAPRRICAAHRPTQTMSENTRKIVDLILSNDPLANRIGSTERRRDW